MNLVTYCRSCKKDTNVKSNASTRPDLQVEKGSEFNVNCQHCGSVETKHVNNIRAKPSRVIILIGLGIGILATILLWISFGAIGAISIIIPILVVQQQRNTVKAFNSYMVSRK